MKLLASLAMLMAGLSGAASAQIPSPFGGPIEPGGLPKCTKEYVKMVQSEITGMEKLRAAGPVLVGKVCTLIESGSAIVGGELPAGVRQQIKGWLGVDVDLRFIKMQCRQGQGNLDRELMSQIGYLKSELMRCNDTI